MRIEATFHICLVNTSVKIFFLIQLTFFFLVIFFFLLLISGKITFLELIITLETTLNLF